MVFDDGDMLSAFQASGENSKWNDVMPPVLYESISC